MKVKIISTPNKEVWYYRHLNQVLEATTKKDNSVYYFVGTGIMRIPAKHCEIVIEPKIYTKVPRILTQNVISVAINIESEYGYFTHEKLCRKMNKSSLKYTLQKWQRDNIIRKTGRSNNTRYNFI